MLSDEWRIGQQRSSHCGDGPDRTLNSTILIAVTRPSEVLSSPVSIHEAFELRTVVIASTVSQQDVDVHAQPLLLVLNDREDMPRIFRLEPTALYPQVPRS